MPFSWGRLFIGLGTGYIAYDSLRQLIRPGPTVGGREIGPAGVACPGDGSIPCKIYPAGPIEGRARMIADLIHRGSLDPRVRRLAVRAVSKKCEGDQWCTPSRDVQAELGAVLGDLKDPRSEVARGWREIEGALSEVKRNYRYVSDHREVDQFQSAARTLFDLHGGDCDDGVVALGALLLSLGYPVKTRIYTLKGHTEPGHIALRVSPDKQGRTWTTIDPSVDSVRVRGKRVPIYVGWDAATDTRIIGSYKDYPV